jgi:SEC-C motif-containing protein
MNALPGSSPADLILARSAAFRAGDFAFIYDSYLEGCNFRRQFPVRDEYLAYAQEVLASDIVLLECKVLRVRIDADVARVIFYQKLSFRGAGVETLELANLVLTVDGWRFDYAEKLERAAVARPLTAVDWDDFAQAADKVIF